jgi:choline-sulfatase
MMPNSAIRSMIKASLLLSMAGLFVRWTPLRAQTPDAATPVHRPNILLIITDQQSADAMSCRQGDRYLRTPNMDSLAARGTSFTRAYAANPICIPSRTAMFTGRYPHETGVQNNERVAFDVGKFPTMGTYFRQAGYDTGYVGKWHLLTPVEDPLTSGFAYAANNKNNGADAATPAAVAAFLSKKRDRPFLLVASFIDPHNISEWARGQELPDGEIGPAPAPELCPPAPSNLAPPAGEPEAVTFARKSYQAAPMFPVGGFDEGKWRQYRWAYYRMIERTDALLGRVLASLAATGHTEDTLIVFVADHGDCQGAHGWNQKTVLYEESVRVPFIICPPKAKASLVSDHLVQTGLDLIPTLCDFAGLAQPAGLTGLSQRAPAESGATPDPRRFVVSSNHLVQGVPLLGQMMKPAGRMLRTARYKYCVYDQGQARESLVDLYGDPGELTNLAADPALAGVLNEHRALLLHWSEQSGDHIFPYVLPAREAH